MPMATRMRVSRMPPKKLQPLKPLPLWGGGSGASVVEVEVDVPDVTGVYISNGIILCS